MGRGGGRGLGRLVGFRYLDDFAFWLEGCLIVWRYLEMKF